MRRRPSAIATTQGAECGGAPWRPRDFPDFSWFQRMSTSYNEVIVDSRWWDQNLPWSVEFLAVEDLAVIQGAEVIHNQFLERYADKGITRDNFPLVHFDKGNFQTPFTLYPTRG